MLEREIYDRYRIYPDEITNIGDDYLIFSESEIYLIRPIDGNIKGKLQEKVAMAEWLSYYGENGVATFVKNKEGKRQLVRIGDKEAVVLQLPKWTQSVYHSGERDTSLGRRLALFHQKGIAYTPQEKGKEALVPWKDRWERRLDQLEKWYIHLSREKKKSKFDEEFLLTYPYFMGITENAIQLLADLYLDVPEASVNEYVTICHTRFKEDSWLTVEEGLPSRIKVPTDFMYDHFSRDIGEYIRHLWQEYGWSEECKLAIDHFLKDYMSHYKLSNVDKVLTVARLMFPGHYFQIVEKYYQTIDDNYQKQCLNIFQSTQDYEEVIRYVIKHLDLKNKNIVLPKWLDQSREQVSKSTAFF